MDIKPALASGIQGIQTGLRGAQDHAAEIASVASFEGGVTSVAEPLLGLKLDLVQVQVSAKVIETVDQILASLLQDRRGDR